jgi:hypothetical protein
MKEDQYYSGKIRTITELEELEFAISDSRSHSDIVPVKVPKLDAAWHYLEEGYDAGLSSYNDGDGMRYDVWACEGDWRLILYE